MTLARHYERSQDKADARIVTLANDRPAHSRRRSGYVTQSLIDQHGSKDAALAWLNRSAQA